jgi:DNA-3-methyladenine glycosylase
MGCFFGCKYCYSSRIAPFRWWWPKPNTVRVKLWLPERLDRELERYRTLPEALKRVQVNEYCEGYLPEVMITLKRELGRDLMAEILGIFEKHWNSANRWMVHLLTKSHFITRHTDILRQMHHMVQVEMTIECLHEEIRRKVAPKAPTIKKRLEAVKILADAGVFVRIMAMPFIGSKGDDRETERREAKELWKIAKGYGAKAFKHKRLNYFRVEDVLRGEAVRVKAREDKTFDDLLIENGKQGGNTTKGKGEIGPDFFARSTLEVARDLLGKVIEYKGKRGTITEIEAYREDEASHAVTRRNTPGARLMRETFGHIYVYRIHKSHCLNFTTEKGGVGAVLIRTVEPIARGPGRVCQAFDIGLDLSGRQIGTELKVFNGIEPWKIEKSPRIGVSKATDLEWRFVIPKKKGEQNDP